jgi:hypothetical protein
MMNKCSFNLSILNLIKIRAGVDTRGQIYRRTIHGEAVSLPSQFFVSKALKLKEDSVFFLEIRTLLVKIMIIDSSVMDGPICLRLI